MSAPARPRRPLRTLALGMAFATTVLAACGGDDETSSSGAGGDRASLQPVTLQLQWVAQSQFAGYYAAVAQGFYADEGLDVTIKEGAVDIVPQQVLASGGADFAIAWVPKALVSREEGAEITNVAQVFRRSGTRQVSWRDEGIDEPADLEGKRVGSWGFGNEFELLAAMRRADVDPESDVTIVQQPFDMSLLLNREVDAAQAMTYNEYAQVLEAENPETGELYQPDDLNVIDFNETGTAMLQDAIWARTDWLADEANREVAERFVKASLRGWAFCRDEFDACLDTVLANGPALGEGHMRWQLNEVNKLIWPSEGGVGLMDEELWDQTVEVATGEEIVEGEPDADAYTTDVVEAALAELRDEGVDVAGADFEPLDVEVTPGGE